jgi:hypothetical protein
MRLLMQVNYCHNAKTLRSLIERLGKILIGSKSDMLKLPSMWILIISTFAFFIATAYLRRYLDEQGIPKGMTRGVLVAALASLVAWGAGAAASWTQTTLEEKKPETQTSGETLQPIKDVDQGQP